MSKTKFIKILVSERLPKQSGEYICFSNKTGKEKILTFSTTDSFDSWYFKMRIESWLEEIPDREEEMIEMLEELKHVIENAILEVGAETTYQLKIASGKISSLLQSLKQT